MNHFIAYKKFLLIFILAVLSACVEDDQFDTPDISIEEPNITGIIVDIDAVIGALNQSTQDIVTFGDTDTYMEGYVISSDEGGNFFEELVLQDKPENPTAGIVIQIDVNPLFTIFQFGRKIYVKLDGLSVSTDNGVIQLGRRDGNTLEKIPASRMSEYLIRSTEVATIIPLEMAIEDFSEEFENLFIRLTDVQFNRNEVLFNPKTFASEDDDQFDGERLLESCSSNRTVILSTSTFSDFKSLLLPSKSGYLDGVLTRDFYDEFYTVYVNSPEAIVFENDERCDPAEFSCGTSLSAGSTVLFSDDFENESINTPISRNGWTNYIEAGSEAWEAYRQSGTNASQGISARIGSQSSNEDSNIAWLISPEIVTANRTNLSLQFETSTSFADNSILQVLVSYDWDGTEANVTTANWALLPDAYVARGSDFFGDWIKSGLVDLSCGSGNFHIAFRFIGSGQSNFDGIYELDLVQITAD